VPVGVYAAVFSRALRSLHASRHAGAVMSKPDFMRAFGLTSRQYNAVKFSLDGMESSIVELRPGRIADLQHRIEAAVKKLAKLRDPDPAPPKKPSKRSAGKEPQTFEEQRAQAARAAASLAFKIHNVTRRRADLARRLAALEAEGHPRICFGSRNLFNAQHHLAENGFASHADWRAAWRAKRDAQFFVLGSKDESAGCQGCVMTHLGGNRFSLKLRLDGEAQRWTTLEVSFAYGVEHILAALKAKQAMSYRFLRDELGWRVFVSTAVIETPTCSDVRLGAIGVDFNVGFVSVSETDRFGNIIASQDVAMVTAGLSKHATQTAISRRLQRLSRPRARRRSRSRSSFSTSPKRKRSCRTRRPAGSGCCRRLRTPASPRPSALARTMPGSKWSKCAPPTARKSALRNTLAGTA
jgi:hypothetical protein